MNLVTLPQKKVNLKNILHLPQRKDILSALFIFICQRASFFGMYPFGCIMFATLSDVKTFYLAIPALIAGTLTSGASAARYSISALIICISRIIYPKTEKNRLYMTGVCTFAVFIGGIYEAFTKTSVLTGFLLLLAETCVTAISVPIFANVRTLYEKQKKNEPAGQECAISFVILLIVAFMGLSGIPLPFSIDLKTVAAIYLILCITMYQTISVSCVFALVCGFITSINSQNTLTMAGVYAVSAVFASLLKYFGKIGAACGMLTGITISVLTIGNIKNFDLSLIDIFIASAVFAFIPMKYHQRLGIFLANTFRGTQQRRDFRIKEYITEELNCFSNTFSEFSGQFKGAFRKEAESSENIPSKIIDKTADRICVNCHRFSDCWQKKYNDTYKYLFSALDTIETAGYCDIHNAPIIFTQKCVQPELLLNELSHVYENEKRELLRRGEQTSERRMVSDQYKEISKIINELSEEIRGNFFFDEQKEKQIINICQKEAIYVRDINVVKNNEGYYEVFFAPGSDTEIERISEIASEVTGMKMEKVFCKNKSIIKLGASCIYDVDISLCQRAKDNEEVSGDTVIHFKTDKNKYYIILCDGMGSGADASGESRMSAELLGGFLKAGFSKNAAINLINSTLALKMEREGFSTVDLCEIDLRSGRVEFIKIGAAQSYIKKKDEIEVFSKNGLPAGILENINTENMVENLAENDMIVMVSDGISETGYGMKRGEWVKKIMKEEYITGDELSKSIVSIARKKIYPKTADDMTCVVIKLKKIEAEEEEKAV